LAFPTLFNYDGTINNAFSQSAVNNQQPDYDTHLKPTDKLLSPQIAWRISTPNFRAMRMTNDKWTRAPHRQQPLQIFRYTVSY
jgi:hypothetical protein